MRCRVGDVLSDYTGPHPEDGNLFIFNHFGFFVAVARKGEMTNMKHNYFLEILNEGGP